MNLVELHGFVWPDVDLDRTFERYVRRAPDMDEAIKLCAGRETVVQAGGHCGVWPDRLSRIFKNVYTFEPDQANFQCLVRNCKAENVYPVRGVLGDGYPVSLEHNSRNTGGHFVKGRGTIPSFRIDQLNLPALNLIILDVEGSELQALQGASRSIAGFSPVIMFEDNGNSLKKGGYPAQMIYDFLSGLGYSEKKRVKDDVIWTRGAA